MRECEFWTKVRKDIPRGWMARRIEDASGNLGTWDTFIAHRDHGAGWIELKVAGPNAKPELRPGQAAFGRNLVDAGIPGVYLVGSDNGRVRMIGPLTTGDDWEDHLIAYWNGVRMADVLKLLFAGADVLACRDLQPAV